MRTGVLFLLAAWPLLIAASPALAGAPEGEPPPRHERSSSWTRLPAAEREAVRKNYERFAELPPDKKARVRANYKHWKQLPAGRREHLRARYEKWQNMTEDERAVVRSRCAAGACRDPHKTGRSTCP